VLDWPILRENWNKNQSRITQKRDRNQRYPTLKHTLSFKRGYKCKEREGDLSYSLNGRPAAYSRPSPSFPRQNWPTACTRLSHFSQRED